MDIIVEYRQFLYMFCDGAKIYRDLYAERLNKDQYAAFTKIIDLIPMIEGRKGKPNLTNCNLRKINIDRRATRLYLEYKQYTKDPYPFDFFLMKFEQVAKKFGDLSYLGGERSSAPEEQACVVASVQFSSNGRAYDYLLDNESAQRVHVYDKIELVQGTNYSKTITIVNKLVCARKPEHVSARLILTDDNKFIVGNI